MFESYDLIKFGNHLRKLRNVLGLTQKDVEQLSGLTADALRRIENGEVVPRYDTLLYLSHTYKKDLLAVLKSYSNANELFEYYRRLEDLLVFNDLAALEQLSSEFSNYVKNNPEKGTLVDGAVVKQFRLTLSGVSEYYSFDPKKGFEYFSAALKVSHPDFAPEQFDRFRYFEFESRILLMVAVSLSELPDLSNRILLFCLEHLNNDLQATIYEKYLRVKIYFNLSYNYHIMDDHQNALLNANKGIDCCNKYYLSYSLGPLLYRKGIAEFLLGIPSYLESLQSAIQILVIQNANELAEKYKTVTQETYGIIL
jgi:transcriptional regulator with XRE-family HTH domain